MSCFHASMPLQAERKLEQGKSQRYLLTFRDELEMLQGAMRKTLVTKWEQHVGTKDLRLKGLRVSISFSRVGTCLDFRAGPHCKMN